MLNIIKSSIINGTICGITCYFAKDSLIYLYYYFRYGKLYVKYYCIANVKRFRLGNYSVFRNSSIKLMLGNKIIEGKVIGLKDGKMLLKTTDGDVIGYESEFITDDHIVYLKRPLLPF